MNSSSLARPYTLGFLFRKLRVNRGLTKGELSKKFCVSEELVSAVESGSESPSLLYCLLCAREFGANEEWIKRRWLHEAVLNFECQLKKMIGVED